MVELPEFVVQGMIRLSDLAGDLFIFHPQRLELHGQRSKMVLRAGQSLSVEVASVDLARHQVDFRVTKQSLQSMKRA
jgi:ribonuclease R